MNTIKETLIALDIQSLYSYYLKQNVIKKSSIMIDLTDIAFDIWNYMIQIKKLEIKDLGLLMRENMTDEEIIALFWIFSTCECSTSHYKKYTLDTLELINLNHIPSIGGCQCYKAMAYLHCAYNYNKYHHFI